MENTEDGDRWSKRRLHGIGIPTDHRMNTGYGSSNGFNEFVARRDGGAIQLESMYTRGVEKSELERGKSLFSIFRKFRRGKRRKRGETIHKTDKINSNSDDAIDDTAEPRKKRLVARDQLSTIDWRSRLDHVSCFDR